MLNPSEDGDKVGLESFHNTFCSIMVVHVGWYQLVRVVPFVSDVLMEVGAGLIVEYDGVDMEVAAAQS